MKRLPKDRLVILDCDGTLIDSEAVSSRVELAEFHQLGCMLGLQEYLEKVVGNMEEEAIWKEIAADWGVQLPADFVERTRRKVARQFELELKPIAGVKESLQQLPYSLCVASGSEPGRLLRTLEIAGLREFFNGAVFSATEVPRGKPHPDLFQHAAATMGIGTEHCLIVEDSPTGVLAGIRAGIPVLGFTGAGHCPPDLGKRLKEMGCVIVFDDMRELPELCKRTFQD